MWLYRCSARSRQSVMRQHRRFGIVIAVARDSDLAHLAPRCFT
ncbi:hypothetical protein EC990672_2326 [Escherichia coli 99.0672]|uniref:Uncharacterized protein n=1 Tax=Escherichia coli O145:H28 (strain RM12581) TaxID=1248823 RepID=A0ABC7ZR47_ECOLR|nr:hypothetical protein ECRM13514_1800 [Escherichia coli O145:H28 str. RM13514]AHY70304.1 hypothetical protein ECRM12581_8870 [Escherichia coli O145:H28 str. RM12581]EKW85192.1 hypothetical protein EC990672_2326 [Escherichia coli 99.0672]